MGMTTHRVMTAVAAAALAILAAACGSDAAGSNTPAGSSPTGSADSTISVKNADYGSHCPPARWDSDSATTIAAADITTLIVCPQQVLDQPGSAVRLTKGRADFAALLQQIERPSESRKPHQVCPMFALPPEHVLASAGGQWYVVQLPTDACGHYRGPLLGLLNRLRS